MQAVFGDDPVDAALADRELRLAKLLGDDRRGGLGVQKAMAQDLFDGLIGAPVVGLGAGLLGLEGGQTALLEGGKDLVIALPATAIFSRGVGDAGVETLAFHDHQEASGQFIGGCDGQDAGRAGELVCVGIEYEHAFLHGTSLKEGRQCV